MRKKKQMKKALNRVKMKRTTMMGRST
jgi:hypothetical protein